MKYYHCRMHQECEEAPANTYLLRAWIEERAARKGCLVELKGETGIWKIHEVGDGLDEDKLTEQQKSSLVSVTG